MTMTDTNIHLSGAEISILEVDVDNRGLELISHVLKSDSESLERSSFKLSRRLKSKERIGLQNLLNTHKGWQIRKLAGNGTLKARSVYEPASDTESLTFSDLSSDKKLQLILRHTDESFIVVNPDLNIQLCNQKFADLYKSYFGIKIKEGTSILDYAQHKTKDALILLYQKVFTGHKEASTIEVNNGNGQKVIIELSYKPLKDSLDNIIGAIVTATDVTLLEQQRLKLHQNEMRYRTLVENGGDALCILTPEGKPLYVSPSVDHVLGYTEEETMSLDLFSIAHPDDIPIMAASWEKALNNPGVPVEGGTLRIKHKSGKWRWYEATITNLLHDPNIAGIVDNFRDVTVRVEAELKRRETEEKLIQAQNIAKLGYWSLDMESDRVSWSETVFEIFGFDSANSKADLDTLIEAVHLEDKENFKQFNQKLRKTTKEQEVTYRISTKNDNLKYVHQKGRRMKSSKGKASLLSGTIQDVTTLKLAEETLRNSEAQMNTIFNNALDAVVVVDRNGMIANWNPMAEKIFGWKNAEAKGQYLQDTIIPTYHIDAHKKGMKHYHKTGEGPVLNKIFETTAIRKDGKIIDISLGISPTRIRGDEYFIGFISDITHRKEFEVQKEFERRDKEALINTTEDFMWSIDKHYNLIVANKTFSESILAQTGSPIKPGDHVLIEKSFDKGYIELWRSLYTRALSGESIRVEMNDPTTPDHEATWFDTSLNPIEINGKFEGVACYSRDISSVKRFQKQLIAANEKLQTAQQIARLGYWEVNLQTNELYLSDQIYKIWGLPKGTEINLEKLHESIHPDDSENFMIAFKECINKNVNLDAEHRIMLPDGDIKWVMEKGEVLRNDKGEALSFEGTVLDITAQKRVETELSLRNDFIESAMDNLPIGIAINKIDDGSVTLMNRTFNQIYGWPPEALSNLSDFFKNVYPDKNFRKKIFNQVIDDINSGNPERMNWEEIPITTQSGEVRIVNCKNISLPDQNLMISTVVDVTKKIKAEQGLRESNQRFEYAGKASFDAIWDWDLRTGQIFWGDSFARNFGHDFEENISSIEMWESLVHPDELSRVNAKLNAAILNITQVIWDDEYQLQKKDGPYVSVEDRGYILRNEEGKAIRIIGAIQDITSRKKYETELIKLNNELKERAQQLAVSNAELEQFAYVASHDLQEPLRMVTSFLTQLEKKYESDLDDKARQYIHFASDGALRMRQIILDLLAYSRVGSEDEKTSHVDMNNVCENVLILNKKLIAENDAKVTCENLPVITAYATPILQLMQNLVTNAVRYRKKSENPIVHIASSENTTHWMFSVSDNGIGIDKRFQDKIFIIFQRLHNKKDYPGTGIGLAICKKIIEVHKGEISVESSLNKGSTFHFSIRKPRA